MKYIKTNTYKNLRYHLALSSLAKIYGVSNITEYMLFFCREWSNLTYIPPIDKVEEYFKKSYEEWK
jgi:hypothetical protein